MKLLSSDFRSRQAFTLIELLVVISIIGVLAAILLPVASKVMINAQKVQAKSTELQIVTAVKAFKSEYGTYPIPVNSPVTNADICFGTNAPTEADLLHILMADKQGTEEQVNTRGIVYIELPQAKNQTKGHSKNGLGADGNLYDPWGNIYLVGVDGDYSDTVPNPYKTNAGTNPLNLGVIVYSWGPDGTTNSNFFGSSADKNDSKCADDVISWQ